MSVCVSLSSEWVFFKSFLVPAAETQNNVDVSSTVWKHSHPDLNTHLHVSRAAVCPHLRGGEVRVCEKGEEAEVSVGATLSVPWPQSAAGSLPGQPSLRLLGLPPLQDVTEKYCWPHTHCDILCDILCDTQTQFKTDSKIFLNCEKKDWVRGVCDRHVWVADEQQYLV